jgi:hypothetical protein
MMDFRAKLYSSTAGDKLSSPSNFKADWLSELYIEGSCFSKAALPETNKKSRKLADGSAASFTAKDPRLIKRKQPKRRRVALTGRS